MFNYYIEKGMVECTLSSQLVPTGSRMSSSKPLICSKLLLQNSTEKKCLSLSRDRLVDSDYSSAELFYGYLSGDKQLLFAVGYDLHSYSSFLIFGQKWLV
jgi:hypothetical protein